MSPDHSTCPNNNAIQVMMTRMRQCHSGSKTPSVSRTERWLGWKWVASMFCCCLCSKMVQQQQPALRIQRKLPQQLHLPATLRGLPMAPLSPPLLMLLWHRPWCLQSIHDPRSPLQQSLSSLDIDSFALCYSQIRMTSSVLKCNAENTGNDTGKR